VDEIPASKITAREALRSARSFDPDELVPDPQVARKDFNRHPRTLKRWEAKPELNFPPRIMINGMPYRRRGDIEEFKRRQMAAQTDKQTDTAA
jgi:hypothetical protein